MTQSLCYEGFERTKLEYLCKNIKKKIWIRSAGLCMERMDLNIRDPHFVINDAHNWYREMIHGQLLRIGERLYGDPASGMQYSFCVLSLKSHLVIDTQILMLK